MAEISDEALELLSEHSWDETIPRLAHYALWKLKKRYWLGVLGGPTPAGIEAKDIVMKSIEKVLNGKRVWDPQGQPDLFLFLKGVVDSEISHLVQGWENTHVLRDAVLSGRSADEENQTGFWETVPDPGLDAETEIIDKELERQSEKFFWDFYEYLEETPKLQKILESISEGNIKRAEIAKDVGIKVKEFDNLKKQLQRRLKLFQEKTSGGTQ
ncbi:hypothetical protein SAMN02745165_01734 [Malonomonas rubra DSM 5091]|uniref:Uncharacterized protein n=1 Tax=Malonomonas rubra DSM 5091 TaxID=1122189 RepID=A0A1M6H8Q8_MALRU|nr:hypothetical protein [Malonomonas rubra]SHJ18577.1 hypothetical protein SAMN02745165_01734 [Malonomonas rubra DSM 5091]